MFYIINPQIGIRSWWRTPYAYYIRGVRDAQRLTQKEFEFLYQCDGLTELESSEFSETLVRKGFIRPCKKGEKSLTAWQRKVCDNRYFPAINWMITGKCNYNCLHCFNAADNAPLMSEFTREEAKKLLDEAQECGINAFTITGGEPMLHKSFFEIIDGIYERDMYVEELNTNGYFINQDSLDKFKEIGCYPLIKISFDGLGHHDWLRNRNGAEEDALRAIGLCIKNGFRVKVQTNVHRLNVESMLDTAKMLDKMGVNEMRIIRTTEAPRWVQNGGDNTLTLNEYFDKMLDFLEEYKKTNCVMEIDIWQFVHFYPQNKCYRPRAVECVCGEYKDSLPVCRGNRGMVAIAANGNLFPCHQMSGYYESCGWYLGNVKKEGLKKYLQSGDYLDEVCTTVKDLKTKNEKCASCKWFEYCVGGCRAMGLALTGDKLGTDTSKCLFFNGGYMEKLKDTLSGFRDITGVCEK